MTTQTTHHVRPGLWAAAGLLLAGVVTLLVAPTTAVPPGGPSPDTAGTSGTVTPRTLRAGEVIAFSIAGFPAGETVSVKIDDGDFCSAKAVHGACVVHQQKIAADGTVKGSFAVPADLPRGSHWLRFLASEEIVDDEGRYKGVKPYSLKGDTDFEIVAATPATSSTGGSGSTDQSGSTPSDDPTSSSAPQAGGVPASQPSGGLTSDGPLSIPAPPGAGSGTRLDQPDVVSDPGADRTEVAPVEVAAAPAERDAGVPFVGTAALVLAAAGALLLGRRRRDT